MTGMSDTMARWCAGVWRGPLPVPFVEGVAHDSREVRPGCLYVAIRGERLDGHDFLEQAFQAGAAAALVSRRFADAHPKPGRPWLVVEDTRRGLMDLAMGYRETLRGLIVGITGSVGKTTVKEMLADILARQGRVARTRGNRNNDLGLPLSLLSMKADDDYGVFEAGINHPGEMADLSRILRPDWGLITVVGAAHLGFFESEKQIAMEKAELFRALPKGGMAVLDMDQRWANLLLGEVACRRLIVSSRGHAQAQFALRAQGSPQILCVEDRVSGRTLQCAMPVPGRHMMQDALLALATGISLGVDAGEACAAIEAFRPVGMRWAVEEVEGVTFINDAYNANPLSMRAALATFAEWPARKDKWVVLGGMGELGAGERAAHEELGAELAGGPWKGLLVVGTLGAGIADGAARAGLPAHRLFSCANAREASALLRGQALAEGDAVLLKASRSEKLEQVLVEYKQSISRTLQV